MQMDNLESRVALECKEGQWYLPNCMLPVSNKHEICLRREMLKKELGHASFITEVYSQYSQRQLETFWNDIGFLLFALTHGLLIGMPGGGVYSFAAVIML